MIAFRFNFESEAKDYLIREEIRAAKIARMATALIFMIPAIMIGIIWYYNYIVLMISIGVVLLSCIFLLFFRRWDNPINDIHNVIPTTIVIENDTIERTGIDSYRLVKIENIKEVWDMGNFYAVIFYFPDMDRRFICQKDLIVEGTIEEFEKLFEDKIVRKYATKD